MHYLSHIKYFVRPLVGALVLTLFLVLIPGRADAATCIDTFGYTGGNQFCNVPAGVTYVRVRLWGAGGGGGSSGLNTYTQWGGRFTPFGTHQNRGGNGGYTESFMAVTPGEALTLVVGEGGRCNGITNTYGGGGKVLLAFKPSGSPYYQNRGASGGGRAAVFADGDEAITAGGGGGSVCEAGHSHGGAGGGVGTAGVGFYLDNAGNGLGGAPWGPGGVQAPRPCRIANCHLQNGTAGARGLGGTSGRYYGNVNTFSSGGGGGGGYYGGGGGIGYGGYNNEDDGGGGGGGSGFCGPRTVGCTMTTGAGSLGAPGTAIATPGGNGRIIISVATPPTLITAPTITGASTGVPSVYYPYTFSGSTDTTVGAQIRYEVDWNNDNALDEWAAPYSVPNGGSASAAHPWPAPGTYTLKARAVSTAGNISAWSLPFTVTIPVGTITPPTISGQTPADIGVSYDYTFSNSTDSTGVGVAYQIDWESDGIVDDTIPGFYDSTGAPHSIAHTWPTAGVSTILARAANAAGGMSAWASYPVTVNACVPSNICSGDEVVNSCTGATVNYCAPGICSLGACVAGGPAIVVGALSANPERVRIDSSTRISWNVLNAASCTVVGSNGDSWSTTQSSAGGELSSPITTITTYTLNCTGIDGSTVNESVNVRIMPRVQEL